MNETGARVWIFSALVLHAAGCQEAASDLRSSAPGLELGPLAALPVSLRSTLTFGAHDESDLRSEDGASIVRLRIVHDLSREEAQQRIDTEVALLTSLYEQRPPPYPEFLTRSAGCHPRFAPEVHPHAAGRVALLVAGAGLDYGVCADDLVRFRAVLAHLYCAGARELYRIEYFTDVQATTPTLLALAESWRCARP
jgi:hypothetical protein